jgi:hypothetical protein
MHNTLWHWPLDIDFECDESWAMTDHPWYAHMHFQMSSSSVLLNKWLLDAMQLCLLDVVSVIWQCQVNNLQQWRLRSPFCMNHCAPRVIAECNAHKFFFACTRTRSGPFPGDPDRKAPRRPTLSGGTPEPFLDKLRKSLNQISEPEEPWLRFIHNWGITGIQLMVRWWVLVHCGPNDGPLLSCRVVKATESTIV